MIRTLFSLWSAATLLLVASCDPVCVDIDLRDAPRELIECDASRYVVDCAADWDPVCGDDDRTYANDCVACASVAKYSTGMCPWETGYNISSEEHCTAAGGVWGPVGLNPDPLCNLPTTDGGTLCVCSGQCQGECIGGFSEGGSCETVQGYCSNYMMVVGCGCYFYADGPVEMCVD